MSQYVLMIQIDADDKDITESAMADIRHPVPIKYITGINELDRVVTEAGLPSIIMINDRGVMNPATNIISHLKTHSLYSYIPVIILGEVSATDHIRQYYRAGASSFIIKPSSIADTHKKIKTFFEYWFEVAEV